jgi:hypothetical protein
MGQFSRDELRQALEVYEQMLVRCVKSWDWNEFADQFTEDALYIEHDLGTFHGREEIREWILKLMGSGPARFEAFPTKWYFIDEEKGWVLGCFENRKPDLGDGKEYTADSWTMLKYAGDGKWSYQEDMYNSPEHQAMMKRYNEAATALATK